MDPVQLQPPPPPKSHVGTSYLFAILVVVLCGVIGVLGILYMRPGVDNSQMILAYIGFCGIALTQLVNFIKINDVKTTAQETHVLVNSQMAELKRTIAELEYAKGITEGIAQQREVTKVRKLEETRDKEIARGFEAQDRERQAQPRPLPPPNLVPTLTLDTQDVKLDVAGTLTQVDKTDLKE